MRKIFKTKNFARWARKERVMDSQLVTAVKEMEAGFIDGDLGSYLFKKRLPRAGEGKRGGHRVLIAFNVQKRIVFLFGFSKNDRENIDEDEEKIYKDLACYYLHMSDQILLLMLKQKKLIEVCDEKER